MGRGNSIADKHIYSVLADIRGIAGEEIMKITNNNGLPSNFLRACETDQHKKADISVTELERSPREYWLSRRHDDEIYVDVSDRIWLLFGRAVHKLLEDGSTKNQLTEQYLTTVIDGITLSGTSDLFDDDKISDYKTTSVFTIMFGSRIEEWTRQLNVYHYLFAAHGFTAKQLEIIALLKDWSRSKAKYNVKYPQSSVIKIDIPIWDKDRIERYIKERVSIIMRHKDTPDKDLPLCTDEERWRKEAVYKCMKAGQVKSKKNFDDKAEAEKYCKDNGLQLIEVPGECAKCQDYCYSCSFCNQYMTGSEPPVGEFEQTLNAAKAKFAAPEATLDMLLDPEAK
jgi:hypothetical protein